VAADSPKLGRAHVAEDGPFAAREHRRHPSALIAQAAMPDGVNTTMNAVEAAGFHSTGHTGWGKASGRDLRGAQDAVLVRSKPRDPGVRAAIVDFFSHSERKATNAPLSPPSLPVFGSSTAPDAGDV
jgi:hypothetical protein